LMADITLHRGSGRHGAPHRDLGTCGYSHAVDELGRQVERYLSGAADALGVVDGVVPRLHVNAAARVGRRRHRARAEKAVPAPVIVLALSSHGLAGGRDFDALQRGESAQSVAWRVEAKRRWRTIL
jgi:hypothetical protein